MKKPRKPVDMSSVTTYPLRERINKTSIHDFATLPEVRYQPIPIFSKSTEDSQGTRLSITR